MPLSAQPNAGKPRDIEGRNIYLSRRSTWRRTRAASSRAACAWSAAAAGRRPSTSGRSGRVVRSLAPRRIAVRPSSAHAADAAPPAAPVPRAEKSGLCRALQEAAGRAGRAGAAAGHDAAARTGRARDAWRPTASTRSGQRRAAERRAMSALSLALLVRRRRASTGAAVLLPRPLPARDAVGPARRSRHRHQEPAPFTGDPREAAVTTRTPRPCSTLIQSA